MNLLHYLLHRPRWHRLPMMPRSYSVEYDSRQLDHATVELMRVSHVRCPQGAEILATRHNLTKQDLAKKLKTRRRKRQIGMKFAALIHRAFGTTRHDPMRAIAREHRRRDR